MGAVLFFCPGAFFILWGFQLKLLFDYGYIGKPRLVAGFLLLVAVAGLNLDGVSAPGFDPWFLLPFNLQRQFHLWFRFREFSEDERPEFLTVLAYIWCPILLFSSVEWFLDARKALEEKSPRPLFRQAGQWLLKALIAAYIAEWIRAHLTVPVFTSKEEVYGPALFWAIMLEGPAFFLSMISIFYWGRFFSALIGMNFQFPLFGPVYRARSPVHFWLNWNIPTVHTLREFFFLPLMRKGGMKIQVFIGVLGLWWLIQALWHHNLLWGAIHAMVLFAQIAYIRKKALGAGWARFWHRKIPGLFKIGLTMGFILLSASIWPGGRPDLLLNGILRFLKFLVGS